MATTTQSTDPNVGSYAAMDLANLAQIYGPAAAQFYAQYSPSTADYYTFNVESNKGNSTGNVYVGDQTPVVLVNNATGEVVSSGVGVDAAKSIEAQAAALTAEGGNKANWSIYTAPAGSTNIGDFTLAANEKANQSTLGKIADVGLPVALSLLAPGLGTGLSAAVASGLGAAAGSGLSSALQGRSLEDSLLRAAVSGLGSYAGSSLLQPASTLASDSAFKAMISGLSDTGAGATAGSLAGSAAGSTAGSTLGGYADDIIVNAIKQGLPASAAIGSLLGNIGTNALSSINNIQAPDFNIEPGTEEITVTGQKPTVPGTSPINTGNTPDLTQNVDLGDITAGVQVPDLSGGTKLPNLSLTDLTTLATIGGGLLSGGGGSATSTPYTGTALRAPRALTAADYTVTPYAGDYEKYGFGPAHNFYSQGYYGIVPQAAQPTTTAATTGTQSLI